MWLSANRRHISRWAALKVQALIVQMMSFQLFLVNSLLERSYIQQLGFVLTHTQWAEEYRNNREHIERIQHGRLQTWIVSLLQWGLQHGQRSHVLQESSTWMALMLHRKQPSTNNNSWGVGRPASQPPTFERSILPKQAECGPYLVGPRGNNHLCFYLLESRTCVLRKIESCVHIHIEAKRLFYDSPPTSAIMLYLARQVCDCIVSCASIWGLGLRFNGSSARRFHTLNEKLREYLVIFSAISCLRVRWCC